MENSTSSQGPAFKKVPSISSEQQQLVNRACESCRLLKVRCLPDESTTTGICLRCLKSGRNCVFAAPQKRRQRKRTDTRVAELEREVRAMRLLLERGATNSIPEENAEDDKDSEESESHDAECARTGSSLWADREEREMSPKGQTPNDDGSSLTSHSSIPVSVEDRPSLTKDVIDRGLVSLEVADELVENYKNNLVQHFPAVLLPPNCTARELRRSKPTLFLAVITAACCNYESVLWLALFNESTRLFAERIFINGEKSLELVQALTISSVWYCPPDELASGNTLRFYQYIHTAATMALDIGLGTQIDASAMSLEKSRAICACYLSCAGVAMRMRRPNMLRWTSWMSQCLDLLEKSPASSFLDKRLAASIKLQIITDDYANFFSFEDPSTSVNLADTRMQVTLKGFERQLKDWKRNTHADVLDECLVMAYYQNSIYLHERIAIDGNFDDKENFNHRLFNPPQTVASVSSQQNSTGPLHASYVNAVMACIESMHSLLDIFLEIDPPTLRINPTVTYVRVSYSVVVLIKLYISTYANILGSVLERRDLKVDYYLEACLEKIRETAAGGKYRTPNKWLHILQEINRWYHKYDKGFSQKDSAGLAEMNFQGRGGADHCPGRHDAGNLHDSVFHQVLEVDSKEKNTATDIEMNSAATFFPGTDLAMWILPSNASSGSQEASSQMASLDSFTMDFAPSDFSFLDQPGNGLDANATWMTENSVLGDINFDPSATDWGAEFR